MQENFGNPQEFDETVFCTVLCVRIAPRLDQRSYVELALKDRPPDGEALAWLLRPMGALKHAPVNGFIASLRSGWIRT